MPRQRLPRPTEGELEILRALWLNGPSTVREVQEEVNDSRPIGYTTVLKMLQIMLTKGLVTRDESSRTHVYEPAVPEEKTLAQLARDLLERAFGGSAEKLVIHALEGRKVSRQELAKLRELLDQFEEKRK